MSSSVCQVQGLKLPFWLIKCIIKSYWCYLSNIFQIWFLILWQGPHLFAKLFIRQAVSFPNLCLKIASFVTSDLPNVLKSAEKKLNPKTLFKCHLLCELFSLLPQPEMTTRSCYHSCCLEGGEYTLTSVIASATKDLFRLWCDTDPVNDFWMDSWTNKWSPASAVLWADPFLKFCFPPSILNTQLFFLSP